MPFQCKNVNFPLVVSILAWVAICAVPVSPFSVTPMIRNAHKYHHSAKWRRTAAPDAPESKNPLDGMDAKRKANLFQALLRDLQIEGVPLLECDASQAHTLQAALWTTMAELSEQEDTQRVCLVLEGIAVESLLTFANDFLVLKNQNRLMNHLPELERFSVTVVGKGVGPAIVLETKNVTRQSTVKDDLEINEPRVNAAMKRWIDREAVGMGLCPYAKSSSRAPQGLEDVGIQPGTIGYRICGFSEVCHILSAFWNCICELLVNPDVSCIVLTMPGTAEHDRFSVVAELISRYLLLYRGGDVFETMHFHPSYDRDQVYPPNAPAHGHLPPLPWIIPMLRHNGNKKEADNLSDENIQLSNFQRRSPFSAVVIKRVSHFEALTGSANEIVDLDLGDGRIEKAAGIPSYSRNVLRLVEKGGEALQSALDKDIAIAQ